MTSLIFGYGVTGQSFERYLNKKNIDFSIYDEKISGSNITNKLPNRDRLQSFEMIYLSPGINLKQIYPNGEFEEIPYQTDLDIFFKEDNSYKIGITGTNGKSSCCYYLHQLLEGSQLVGNIGNPVLDNINKCAYSIIELSSFQLEKAKFIELDFGVLLNIEPDHIDHHGSFAEYAKAKNKINKSKVFTKEANPRKLWSMITGEEQSSIRNIQLKNLPHRQEHITTWKNLTFINDSKATNIAALKYALNKMSGQYLLILCGDPNKERYKNIEITEPLKIYIFGTHANDIYKKVTHPNKILLHNKSLETVIKLVAEDIYQNPTTILFSPGHPSGKDFKNFEDRGKHFSNLAMNLDG